MKEIRENIESSRYSYNSHTWHVSMGSLMVLAPALAQTRTRRGHKLPFFLAADRLGHGMLTRGEAQLGTRELSLERRPLLSGRCSQRAVHQAGHLQRSSLREARLLQHLGRARDGAVDLLVLGALAQVDAAWNPRAALLSLSHCTRAAPMLRFFLLHLFSMPWAGQALRAREEERAAQKALGGTMGVWRDPWDPIFSSGARRVTSCRGGGGKCRYMSNGPQRYGFTAA